jgi:hypothetical protein
MSNFENSEFRDTPTKTDTMFGGNFDGLLRVIQTQNPDSTNRLYPLPSSEQTAVMLSRGENPEFFATMNKLIADPESFPKITTHTPPER